MRIFKGSAATCYAIATIALCLSCSNSDEKFPRAAVGHISPIAGNGTPTLKETGRLPNAPISQPTGIVARQDGSLVVLANVDIGAVMRLYGNGQVEPYSRYLTGNGASGTGIKFDASQSKQPGWAGMRPASSLAWTKDGDLWIYAERWIAAIKPDKRALVLGRLDLPDRKDHDLDSRLFNGPGNQTLLVRDGKLYEITTSNLDLHALRLPKSVSKVTSVTAQGNDTLIGSFGSVYRVNNGNVVSTTTLQTDSGNSNAPVLSIAAGKDHRFFAATAEGRIFQIDDNQHAKPLAGVGHSVAKDWADQSHCPPAGSLHVATNPSTAEIGYPKSLLLKGDQLYIADTACNRVYAVGVDQKG